MPSEVPEQLRFVLVAEDSRVVRSLVRRILEDAGFSVKTADDGQAALDLLNSEAHWLALVTDREMPFLDGCALAAHAHQLYPALPVLMMTAHPTRLPAAAVPEIDGYLPKPFHLPEQLLEALRNARETRATRLKRLAIGQALAQIESDANERRSPRG